MMKARLYEETELEYVNAGQSLQVSLPWLSGILDSSRLNLTGTSVKDTRSFFSERHLFSDDELIRLPFVYVLPRATLKNNHGRNEMPEFATIDDLLRKERVPISDLLMPPAYNWTIEEIEELSSIGGGYFDPLTIYTAVRRYRNREMVNRGTPSFEVRQKLLELKTRDEQELFRFVSLLLMQSYYITSHSMYSLSPAVKGLPEIAAMVEDYIKEENGHHHLIHKSLKSLDAGTLEDYIYFQETIASMEVLRYVAREHPAAFCCILGAFESAAHYDSDPMADLLLTTSRPEAAGGLLQHFQINKQGEHADIGLVFASDLQPCDYNGLKAAVHYSELLHRLFEGMALRALTHF